MMIFKNIYYNKKGKDYCLDLNVIKIEYNILNIRYFSNYYIEIFITTLEENPLSFIVEMKEKYKLKKLQSKRRLIEIVNLYIDSCSFMWFVSNRRHTSCTVIYSSGSIDL